MSAAKLSPTQRARHELRQGLAVANRLLRALPDDDNAQRLLAAIQHFLAALDSLEGRRPA